RWWTAGILHLFAVTKVILTWLTESYVFYRTTEEERNAFGISNQPPPGIGYGIGLAFALFIMLDDQPLSSNEHEHWVISASQRMAIIGSIFRKSLRLSGKARAKHTTGQVMTMISTDATRLDQFVMYAHNVWIAPIQLIVGIALLIANIAVARNKGVKITDARVRLTTEGYVYSNTTPGRIFT
ncbi:hypothetical protein MPER_08962, partial [Moniliophthora perniciosa FA553]